MMQWRKRLNGTKSAMSVAAFILVAALFVAPVAAADVSAVGEWRGVIDLPGQPLDIRFVLTEEADGRLRGTVDIPAQGAYDLGLQHIVADGEQLQFAFADIPASVEAFFTDEGSVEGTFHQAGMQFPFRAERIVAVHGDEEQLAHIRSFVEQMLADWQVPGAAVTVVQNGATVMAEGFGLRDVEGQLPVTEETAFGIGSATKAFTATAFQMLVDEGVLRWEQPLREIIPGFRLYDPFVTEHATALDFAVHRSGLPRHDVLWMANPQLDVQFFIANAQHLQPSHEFRTAWTYNNFGYVLLGDVIERKSGQSWADYVQDNLLQPLGMYGTTFSIADMQKTGNFALAYTTAEDGWEQIELQELGAAAAAGAINSNALDMGQWLLFQLNKGRVGDVVLVSEDGMENLHTPHILISASPEDGEINFAGYGPGWMIDLYRGHYRVHHGGNTIGYSANVAFVPSAGIGVAVLTNALYSPVPELVTNYVLDTLLGLEPIDWNSRYKGAEAKQQEALTGLTKDAGKRPNTVPAHDLAEYEGTYAHPAYGTLHIEVDGGGLRATYYDLDIPLEHWHFEQFRGPLSKYISQEIPFVFETDAVGDVAKVHVGFEPTVEPVVFVRTADDTLRDVDYLQQFVGEYDLMGMTIDVSLRAGVLVLTVPGQPPYHLEPIREGQFVFRDYDGFGVHFAFADDGTVTGAVLIQPHGNVELKRK